MSAADLRRIEQLLARAEARVRRAIRRFLDDARSPEIMRQVRRMLERGSIEEVLRIVDSYSARVGEAIPDIFISAGAGEMEALAEQLRRQGVRLGLSFDPSHPRAAELMRRNRLEFIREFTRAQRLTVRDALAEALQSGLGPIQAAREFRDSIGLTQHQRRSVANYRRLLEAGDVAALERDLRDRRFDSSVRRALRDGEPLGAERIRRMVARYRERFLQYRAEVIARTESLRVLHQAREEALSQIVEDIELPPGAVRRVWASTRDKRVRDTHRAMDGQVRAMNEPFDSPSGARLPTPGDGSLGAPPGELINCRCVVLIQVSTRDVRLLKEL